MSRVYWDTMLFVYLLEDHPEFSSRVSDIWSRMQQRQDQLCTSSLTVGEILVAPYKLGQPARGQQIDDFFRENVEVRPFSIEAARRYAEIRAKFILKAPDAIHLACAAEARTDLFLTNDKTLIGKSVPGIQFIAGLNTDVL